MRDADTCSEETVTCVCMCAYAYLVYCKGHNCIVAVDTAKTRVKKIWPCYSATWPLQNGLRLFECTENMSSITSNTCLGINIPFCDPQSLLWLWCLWEWHHLVLWFAWQPWLLGRHRFFQHKLLGEWGHSIPSPAHCANGWGNTEINYVGEITSWD